MLRTQNLGKKVRTLSAYVQLLMDTSRFIASRVRDGKLLLVDKEIVGDLQFVRDEKE